MPAARLLLVAPDTDLRRSLAFALGAEGFTVALLDRPPAASGPPTQVFDCTIVDQNALTGAPSDVVAFCIRAHPVVLLANRPHPWLVDSVAEIIDLPLAGNAVSAAVQHAMHAQA